MGGVGSLAGAVGSARMTARIGLGPMMVVCMFVAELAGILIPAAYGPRWLVLAFLFLHQLIADGFHVAFLVQAVSLRQRVLPLEVLARSNAAFQAVTGALLPLGALTAGLLGDAIGMRPAMWIGMSVSVAAPIVLLPLWRVKEAPVTSPAAPAPAPSGAAAGPPGASA
jgi:predicted MFS family arabinose efflux permease